MVPHVHEDTVTKSAAGLSRAAARSKKIPLSAVLVGLILDLLHLDLHSVLGEHDVLAFHLLARGLADILHDGVNNVADRGEDGHEDEEKDQREEVAQAHIEKAVEKKESRDGRVESEGESVALKDWGWWSLGFGPVGKAGVPRG